MNRKVIPAHKPWVAFILEKQDSMSDNEIALALHSTPYQSVTVMRRLYGLKRPQDASK